MLTSVRGERKLIKNKKRERERERECKREIK
jgi:hypothetical protein